VPGINLLEDQTGKLKDRDFLSCQERREISSNPEELQKEK
jgi:hypothetical protein